MIRKHSETNINSGGAGKWVVWLWLLSLYLSIDSDLVWDSEYSSY